MLRRLTIMMFSVFVLVLPGCATRCEKALDRCHAECQRNYRQCQASGNDEYYCGKLIGNCAVQCDNAKLTCHWYWP